MKQNLYKYTSLKTVRERPDKELQFSNNYIIITLCAEGR